MRSAASRTIQTGRSHFNLLASFASFVPYIYLDAQWA